LEILDFGDGNFAGLGQPCGGDAVIISVKTGDSTGRGPAWIRFTSWAKTTDKVGSSSRMVKKLVLVAA
jgi:hypothetical protein